MVDYNKIMGLVVAIRAGYVEDQDLDADTPLAYDEAAHMIIDALDLDYEEEGEEEDDGA